MLTKDQPLPSVRRKLRAPSTTWRWVAFVLLVFTAASWFAVRSPQYEAAKSVLHSQELATITGRTKFYVLTAFNISGAEGFPSSVSFYVSGERTSGYLRVTLTNGARGPEVVSASMAGVAVSVPPHAAPQTGI